MYPYRVFISYSHQDIEIVKKMVGVLEEDGLAPMWDKNFTYGVGFHRQIQSFISHAHVFLPLITEVSNKRGWVHQEIGYAMARNIPVLPVAIGALPGEMLQQLHAVILSSNEAEMAEQLSGTVFENLVEKFRDTSHALYRCAELPDNRAMMLTEYANDVLELGATGVVRQKGALSSLHIPGKVTSNPVWQKRFGDRPKSIYHCEQLRKERLVLEKHARAKGCFLIIDPSIPYQQYGSEARIVRLQTLIEFLQSMPDEKAQVVTYQSPKHQESITIVGDWFSAESVSSSIQHGYFQTIYTTHAPSMQSKIDQFDQEFQDLLALQGWTGKSSRTKTIELLQGIIDEIAP